ncbi:MAG: hypothetical protein K0Q89_1690, partial [Thermomicrobiales bacterium]|nr:hypothetical protein [Thermomicrobiales bacterium]
QRSIPLKQQDAEDATAGATGESGTVNGVPRETSEAAPVTTGPGAPLAPGEVMLPPSVPGLPAPGVDPVVAGAMSVTTEVAFDAMADTTVFTATPNAPQSPESAELLAIGGPQGAVTLISFDVTDIGEGTVLSALLTFTGAGAAGAPGGSVGVIYDYVARDGLTANDVPDGGSALNVHGVPSWFEAVEPGGLTAVDEDHLRSAWPTGRNWLDLRHGERYPAATRLDGGTTGVTFACRSRRHGLCLRCGNEQNADTGRASL